MRRQPALSQKTLAYMGLATKDAKSDIKSSVQKVNDAVQALQEAFSDYSKAYYSVNPATPDDFINAVGGKDVADLLDELMSYKSNFTDLGVGYGAVGTTLKKLLNLL